MDKTLESPKARRAVVHLNIPFRSAQGPRPGEGALYADSATKHRYMEALGREFDAALPLLDEYSVPAICVSGGSPSVMRPDDVSALLRRVRAGLNLERGFELSMQALPQTVGTPCMEGMKAGGVNRVDLQVLSALDAELERAGCGYRRDHVENAIRFISRFAFREVGFDVMCGLPGQEERTLRESVKFWTFYEPEYIRLAVWDNPAPQPAKPDDGKRTQELFDAACEGLQAAGYRHYADYAGCAHFVRAGKGGKYTEGALAGLDVFAFGLGATSFMDGVECTTTQNLTVYLDKSSSFDKIVEKAERLSNEGRRRRLAQLGLLCDA